MSAFLTPIFQTPLHRANPVVKLVLVITMFLITLFTYSLDFIAYQTVLLLLLLFGLTGLPPWKILVIMLPFLLVFVSSAVSMILFGKGDQLWWQWGLIRITEESFYRGIHLGFKSVALGTEGLLFVLSTSSVSLFYALMQKARLRPKYAYSFMASIRLLPMVWEEFKTRREALRIRGVRRPRGPRGYLRLVKLYGVPLLAQSIRRAHRVATAMESKQFDDKRSRSYYYPSVYSASDLQLALLLAGAVAAAVLLTAAFPWFGLSDVRYH
ncbi:energy-coupling factor transporter transmembrane protein EcfT [Paenibacillus sp. CAA11]|uniref:energy-coupling factor transporter transmembrane component T family protein n=1 Tax=Paenibacillus sp. CAA11 TaxID=1532905 RepID=UPI000D33AC1C|nr:energy-coupling factor transporter transmembrane component T [Paenibacillus sp. CAA11]AWB45831.1 energy-coupling factor transporter transmembrane protein EcfT [Paenibacillus sp. CAA11]